MWRLLYVVSGTLLVLLSGTNGADTCVDILGSQCREQAVQEVVCKDKNSALEFCAKTCGYCPSSAFHLTTQTAHPVTTTIPTIKTTMTTTVPTIKTTITTTIPKVKTTMTTTVPTVKTTMTTTIPTVKTTMTTTVPTVKTTMTTTVPTVETTMTTTVPTVKTDHMTVLPTQGLCKDKLSDCNSYGDTSYACTGPFENWARLNCALYCGFCASETTTQTAPQLTTTIPTTVPTAKTTMITTVLSVKPTAVPKQQDHTTVLPKATIQGVCKDVLPDCNSYGAKSYVCSGQFEKWARSNCALYCSFCDHTLTTSTTTPEPSTVAMATKQGGCRDKIDNCFEYGDTSYACVGSFKTWAILNCAHYCGYCDKTLPTTQMTTEPASTCMDSNEISCTDPQVRDIVCLDPVTASMCPKTCGRCVEPCRDDPSTNCQDPDVKYFVCLDQDTASKLCPKTCNMCKDQNIGAPLIG